MTAYAYLSLPQVGSLVNFYSKEVASFAAEEEIAFGLPVKRGTNPEKEVLLWADAINVPVLGISLFTQNVETGVYKITSTVNVLQKGKIYVTTLLNIIAGEKAYLTVNTGAFTNVALNNLLVGIFTSSGTGVVELSIDIKA